LAALKPFAERYKKYLSTGAALSKGDQNDVWVYMRIELFRPTHLPPFARGLPRELKLAQVIGWSGLDAGCSDACGWLFLA
jgi:hypothetical protein